MKKKFKYAKQWLLSATPVGDWLDAITHRVPYLAKRAYARSAESIYGPNWRELLGTDEHKWHAAITQQPPIHREGMTVTMGVTHGQTR